MTETRRNKPDVTKEQVFEAAEKLYKESGKIPRQTDIKEDIGGSMSTINPLLREWREQLTKREAAVKAVPDYVREIAIQMAALLWKELESVTNKQIAAIQANSKDKITSVEDYAKQNLESLREVEEEKEKLETSNKVIQESLKKANELVQNKDLMVVKVTAERDSMKQQLSEQKKVNKGMQDMLIQFGLKIKKEETNPTSKSPTEVKG